MRLGLWLFVLFLALPAWAGELSLEGDFQQGSLVIGNAPPGAMVALNGNPLRVSPEGRFLLGFGRDAAPEAMFEITYPDGNKEARLFAIARRDYDIQRIDGLPPKFVTPPEEVLARIRRENAQIAEARAIDRPEALFERGFVWPVIGRISGIYGSQRVLNGEPRRPHFGIDIAAPAGTAVVAPSDGVVSLAEDDLYYTGGTIILDHGHGLTSAFLHMKDVEVALGERIAQGQRIGTVGSTGRSTGPHLDWRVNWFKERLDPALLAGPMPES
ncbi:MAG: M23 family metallopeptidase [Pseudomonadota bacterium]